MGDGIGGISEPVSPDKLELQPLFLRFLYIRDILLHRLNYLKRLENALANAASSGDNEGLMVTVDDLDWGSSPLAEVKMLAGLTGRPLINHRYPGIL